jgi:Mg2+/Co2+ transporter CorB
LGLVVDEYGEVRGAIVVEDILEEIVGQFTSNQNEIIDEIVKQEDGSYSYSSTTNPKRLFCV